MTITILGLDPYLLKQLSRELTKQLVEVYECGEDGIDFFAPEGLLLHNGIDQTNLRKDTILTNVIYWTLNFNINQ